MTHFTAECPSVTKLLKLPDPANPNKLLFPREEFWNSYSAVMVNAVMQMEARQLGFGPDWAEARKLQDAERRAEIARNDTHHCAGRMRRAALLTVVRTIIHACG